MVMPVCIACLVVPLQSMEEEVRSLRTQVVTPVCIACLVVPLQSVEEEVRSLRTQAAEREEGLAAREKLVAGKEMTLRRALATVKKLKGQLQQANQQVSRRAGQ